MLKTEAKNLYGKGSIVNTSKLIGRKLKGWICTRVDSDLDANTMRVFVQSAYRKRLARNYEFDMRSIFNTYSKAKIVVETSTQDAWDACYAMLIIARDGAWHLLDDEAGQFDTPAGDYKLPDGTVVSGTVVSGIGHASDGDIYEITGGTDYDGKYRIEGSQLLRCLDYGDCVRIPKESISPHPGRATTGPTGQASPDVCKWATPVQVPGVVAEMPHSAKPYIDMHEAQPHMAEIVSRQMDELESVEQKRMYRTTREWPWCPMHQRNVEVVWVRRDMFRSHAFWYCPCCGEELGK